MRAEARITARHHPPSVGKIVQTIENKWLNVPIRDPFAPAALIPLPLMVQKSMVAHETHPQRCATMGSPPPL